MIVRLKRKSPMDKGSEGGFWKRPTIKIAHVLWTLSAMYEYRVKGWSEYTNTNNK